MTFLARFWFPLCLIALLLLAVPGVVLFGLNLYGLEGSINQWLEQAYQLSYHIPIPWWGALVLLLLPLALLVLYFLKLKRKPLAVPSTFLWKKSIEDLHVNSLLQWLRQNVLLLLQLLTLLALIYGVMAFRFHGRTGEGKRYILMIDNSASMSATDVEPSRLEWAKREALKEIDAATDQDVGMVIVFSSSAEIRQSFTSNRALLRDAVQKVEATERPTRIEEALSLADSLANPIRSTEDVASQPENQEPGKERTYVPPKGVPTNVHLFSDGRFPDLSEEALAGLNSRQAGNESALGNLNLHYHLAGQTGPGGADNVGLVTLSATQDERDPTQYQVFARALSFRTKEVNTQVRLEVFVGGELRKVYGQPLHLPARRVVAEGEVGKGPAGSLDAPVEGTVNFDVPDVDPRTGVVVHAKLMDLADKFPLDDEAWLVINAPRQARVLIVGPPNDVLDKFFEAPEVLDVVRVDRLAPKDLEENAYRTAARNGTYDLVIFDRCAPASEDNMPRSNTFFIGTPPPPWNKSQLERVESTDKSSLFITGWTGSHPVLRYLRALYTLAINEAFRIKKEDLPPRTPVLMEGRLIAPGRNVDIVLLFTLSRQSFTDLVMAFPIISDDGKWNTNWPLDTSFPLFLRNVVYHLGNLNEKAAEEAVQPGQVKRIQPSGTVKLIEVIGPDAKGQTLAHDEHDLRTDFLFGATDRVGVYGVKWNGAIQQRFAVNLLDADESNIEPRTTLQFGSDKVEAGKERSRPRELWKWFAALALAVLMLEWYIYNRRIYV